MIIFSVRDKDGRGSEEDIEQSAVDEGKLHGHHYPDGVSAYAPCEHVTESARRCEVETEVCVEHGSHQDYRGYDDRESVHER